ncbi:hypothetical protein [Streptomyces sp. NPDC093598]|uniref:hypothetical protein n=1 Tax=Streptomyces sp. NPDC093598 TaxID=3366046 RepID=UPI00381FBF7D
MHSIGSLTVAPGERAQGLIPVGTSTYGVELGIPGRAVAEMMDGRPEANPLRGLGFPKVPVPFYNGTPWFLPFGGAYYKAKDKLR